MRLSTSMIYDQQARGIANSQQSWLKVGEQLSSGKRVVNPSDDPVAAAQAVVVSQAQARLRNFPRRACLPRKTSQPKTPR